MYSKVRDITFEIIGAMILATLHTSMPLACLAIFAAADAFLFLITLNNLLHSSNS
jgi:hypothetical protein